MSAADLVIELVRRIHSLETDLDLAKFENRRLKEKLEEATVEVTTLTNKIDELEF